MVVYDMYKDQTYHINNIWRSYKYKLSFVYKFTFYPKGWEAPPFGAPKHENVFCPKGHLLIQGVSHGIKLKPTQRRDGGALLTLSNNIHMKRHSGPSLQRTV